MLRGSAKSRNKNAGRAFLLQAGRSRSHFFGVAEGKQGGRGDPSPTASDAAIPQRPQYRTIKASTGSSKRADTTHSSCVNCAGCCPPYDACKHVSLGSGGGPAVIPAPNYVVQVSKPNYCVRVCLSDSGQCWARAFGDPNGKWPYDRDRDWQG